LVQRILKKENRLPQPRDQDGPWQKEQHLDPGMNRQHFGKTTEKRKWKKKAPTYQEEKKVDLKTREKFSAILILQREEKKKPETQKRK